MLLLAFETSAKAASVALHDGAHLLGETYLNTGLTHSQTLLAAAQSLLAQCGCTAQQVTHLAVAAGPGSFTGLRIGVAAAKGFSWGAALPCYGVSTLEAMALGMGVYHGYVCPVMDARRQQVYNGLWKCTAGVCERIRADRAISLEELEADLKTLDAPVFLVGDGSALCAKAIGGLILPPEHRQHQRAGGVALAALKQMEAGLPGSGAELIPNYLRLSQAERERLARETNK